MTNAETNDEQQVKKGIEQFFNNQLESISTFKAVDNSSIVVEKDFKKYADVKNKLLASWYKKIDERLISYKLYLEYNYIKFNQNKSIVNLNKGLDMIFEKSSEITQQLRGENHIIILKKYDNQWYIENDIFEEGRKAEDIIKDKFNSSNKKKDINLAESVELNEVDYKNTLKNKIFILQSKYDNININAEKFIKEIKKPEENNKCASLEKKPQMVNLYSVYDGDKAVDYANEYWDNYNVDEYSDWNDQGGDCTNFISQCIHAGGIATSSVWYKDSNAWIRVTELRDYLVSNNIAKEYNWQSNCSEGDIIQLYRSEFNNWTHSLLITYRRTDGQIFVTCHSDDYDNLTLFNFYPTSAWTDIRYLKLN